MGFSRLKQALASLSTRGARRRRSQAESQGTRAPAGRLWGTLVLATGTLAAGSAQADFDRRSLIELGGSVLRVESQEDNGRMQVGSGVVIAKERVVTNCHVTRRAKSITVVQAGSRWPVQAQTVNAERDLCVLQVPELPHKPVALGRADTLREGQDLAALGYTGGPALRISGGSVVALHHWGGNLVIQCSNGFSSGASGGGLFDEQGRLVGILTFRLPGGRSAYYAMPAEWLPAPAQPQAQAVDVQPHEGQGFWQGPVASLPHFLQAASLESAGQWDALLQLAERWTREDGADAEPLYLRALAYANLGREQAAEQSWQRSLAVNPGFSRSWAALAELYHRSGQVQQAQTAMASLSRLNPVLARELTDKLGTDALPAQHAAARP